MELRHIRYFLAVAEEMNFTKAADKLCIAQPPLSRQIQDLEEELGVTLFNRKRHAMSLTDEGLLFKQYALQVLTLVDQSTTEVRELKHGLQGTINLASVEGKGPSLLTDWIAEFNKKNPHVQYNIWTGNSDDIAARIMNGLCDVAIIMEPHNGVGLESITVHKEDWVAIIPKSNPLAFLPEDTISMDQLANQELIIPSRSSRLEEIAGWFKDSKKMPTVRCRMAHMNTACELARKGLGITIYPASAADNAKMDEVIIKKLINPTPEASYILVWSKHRSLSHVASTFLDFVKDMY